MNRLKGTENVSLQMIRPSVKAMSIAALVLASSMQLGFSASGQRQSCNGVLILDDGVYRLNADSGNKSLWCAADIGEGDASALAKRVLKTCAVGSHCHIEGSFEGHGIFNWTSITSVSVLKR